MRMWIVMMSLLACVTLVVPAGAQWMECDDEVYAVVEGSTVTVHHVGALYNCCPDPFEYTVSQDDVVIEVVETEVLNNPCFCICCFDLLVQIEDLAPGGYSLIFHWFDYEAGEWLNVALDVVVPDQGQMGDPYVASTYLSDCYTAPTGVPGEPITPSPMTESWGQIKALYH